MDPGQNVRLKIEEDRADLRPAIYRARHQIYAQEIGQHAVNEQGELSDGLDDQNRYLVATAGEELAGFVSITPSQAGRYSIDKYFDRSSLSFPIDEQTYEIRLLTVLPPYRGSDAAVALMMAAFRWIEARGGELVVAIGRSEVAGMYRRLGMRDAGLTAQSGAVRYELMHRSVADLRERLDELEDLLAKIEKSVIWNLRTPLRKPAACFHGGASIKATGPGFSDLKRAQGVINADVLDAWFPPAPGVIATLSEHLPWLLRTSPPAACEELLASISKARGVPQSHLLPGAGSSDLIFRALPRWLSRDSHALIFDPTYGEYAHVLEKVIGCQVERFTLSRDTGYRVDLETLCARIASGPDLVVIVNPNSPTGRGLSREEIELLLQIAPSATRVWIDETYIDYTGESVENLTSRYENLIVCKSMSKVYALSGARVAYLCAAPQHLEGLRALTPPWAVSLPAQVAAVKALADPDYYACRISETHMLREALAKGLCDLNWEVIKGAANFLLTHVPETGVSGEEIVRLAAAQGLYLRYAGPMGQALGERAIRIAVKDGDTQQRMLEILAKICGNQPRRRAAGNPLAQRSSAPQAGSSIEVDFGRSVTAVPRTSDARLAMKSE